jgi:hypothetical protein
MVDRDMSVWVESNAGNVKYCRQRLVKQHSTSKGVINFVSRIYLGTEVSRIADAGI